MNAASLQEETIDWKVRVSILETKSGKGKTFPKKTIDGNS
jgi:hypothetical protein